MAHRLYPALGHRANGCLHRLGASAGGCTAGCAHLRPGMPGQKTSAPPWTPTPALRMLPGASAGIVLNATAWVRHVGNLFLYALTLVTFLLMGLVLGATVYIGWWSITLRRGQTPGKLMVGIRVVRQDGASADWMTLFVREGLKTMLYLMPLGIIFDFFVTMSDADRPLSLADRFTGTMVVRR